MKQTSKPENWPNRKIKKHQDLHFLLKTLCKNGNFQKKIFFVKKMFIPKKIIQIKTSHQKAPTIDKRKNEK